MKIKEALSSVKSKYYTVCLQYVKKKTGLPLNLGDTGVISRGVSLFSRGVVFYLARSWFD